MGGVVWYGVGGTKRKVGWVDGSMCEQEMGGGSTHEH